MVVHAPAALPVANKDVGTMTPDRPTGPATAERHVLGEWCAPCLRAAERARILAALPEAIEEWSKPLKAAILKGDRVIGIRPDEAAAALAAAIERVL